MSRDHERDRLAMIGRKVLEGARRGGRQQPARDIAMAQEFRTRRSASPLSDTALKAEIGSKYRLRRRAAVDAVDRGLRRMGINEKIRAGTGEPHTASRVSPPVVIVAFPLRCEPKPTETTRKDEWPSASRRTSRF